MQIKPCLSPRPGRWPLLLSAERVILAVRNPNSLSLPAVCLSAFPGSHTTLPLRRPLMKFVLNSNTPTIKTSPKRRTQHFPSKQLWQNQDEREIQIEMSLPSQEGQAGGRRGPEGGPESTPSVSRAFFLPTPGKHWTT